MGLAYYWGRRDYAPALAEFSIAVRGLPNDAEAWTVIGYVHRRLGNWSKVYETYERVTRLDPRNAKLFYDLGASTFQLTRRYADAARADEQALFLAPNLRGAAVQKGWTYVLWRGNLDTLRAVLNPLPPDAPLGDLGDARAQRAKLLLWERRTDSLLALMASGPERVLEGQHFFLPTALYSAWAYQVAGDRPAARASFRSALVPLDSAIVDLGDDWRVHAARGLSLAGLGRRAAALAETRWLEHSTIYLKDAAGARVAEARAQILAQAGDADAALDEIERLLAGPSWLSVHTLRLDPRWDPIREHPRFKALLVKYANTEKWGVR
jgi:serine/threonine-protein kinase